MTTGSLRERARSVVASIEAFLYSPVDARGCAAFRIGYATLLLADVLAAFPYVEAWWGEHGVLPFAESRQVIDGDARTLFELLPHDDRVLWACYGLFVCHIVALLVGFHGRLQAIVAYVWLVSFQHRNNLILDGQDTVFRTLGFFLVFMPAFDTWSVDAFLRTRRGGARSTPPRAWALRLVQLQMVLVYAATVCEKLRGTDWRSGVAVYYVTQLAGFYGHFPMPGFVASSRAAVHFLSWSTLAIEALVPVLIWVPRTRRVALATAIGLHLCLEYSMNVFLFEWIMILGWLSFVRRSDLEALRSFVTRSKSRRLVQNPPGRYAC